MRLLLLLSLVSCASSYHQAAVDTSLNPTNLSGQLIRAQAEQFVFLGFAFDTDYVAAARRDLEALCPKGTISPLMTSYYTDLGFLSWKNHVKLEGVCR
jgi:hypothetical protein